MEEVENNGSEHCCTSGLSISSVMLQAIADLRLQDRLSPQRNPDFAWCWCFLPALVGFFSLLGAYLNAKPHIGGYKVYEPTYKSLILSPIEVIATGMGWAEGPIWIDDETKSQHYLLYSDTEQNRIWRYDEGKGLFSVGKSVRIPNSGCKSNSTVCLSLAEPGSNGIVRLYADLNAGADLVVCQHGERAVSLLFENGTRIFLATHYEGKKLNSPNDLAWSNEGHLYFTDPTYGLHSKYRDSMLDQELDFSGVYMIHRDEIRETLKTGKPTEKLKLITDAFNLPNGITFSPGFIKAYISNSDPRNAYWKVFDVQEDGSFANGRVFFNATDYIAKGHRGNPDGMKVDSRGNLFAAGPGGVLIFSPEGTLLGRLQTGNKTVSNVAFGANGFLFMTAVDSILRVKTSAKPAKLVGAWK